MSPDGTLLAVSSMSSIKLFQLRARKSTPHSLKVTKLDLDTKLASLGARILQFSNDGRWLCCVTPESRVHILHFKVQHEDGIAIPTIELPTSSIKLERKERDSTTTKKVSLKDGAMGLGEDYDKQIHKIAFSPNGRILAVTDLGGWIDCWERDESETWVSLTKKSSLPRLSTPAVAIGFRPSISIPQPTTPEQLAVEDSITELIETPPSTEKATSLQLLHQQQQQLIDETTDSHHGLFVLTSAHSLHEFDVKEGTLTAWSKRNPTEKLPSRFLTNMDRASGIVFTHDRQKGLRIWLWGASWVWMFNIDRDLVPEVQKSSSRQRQSTIKGTNDGVGGHKRKRTEIAAHVGNVVMTSGAGSKITHTRNEQVQIFGRDQKSNRNTTSVPNLLSLEQTSDDDNDDNHTEEFLIDKAHSTRFSNSTTISNNLINLETTVPDDDNDNDDQESDAMDIDHESNRTLSKTREKSQQSKKNSEKSSWSTNKYRPLMAFLPIGNADERLEMVVVERPMYDVALPPRFEDKRDLIK